MNTLQKIVERKAVHVAARMVTVPLEAIIEKAQQQDQPRGFIKALREHDAPSIIAEIKKASPSKGIIREDFDPVDIARIYEENGAACLSVLTDEPYFQGQDEYLVSVREAVECPLLRKDFMIDPYQIYESRALGADCILLIMAALPDDLAQELYDLARQLGMDVLVEVHDALELKRALELKPEMIGINNRNLKTLGVDIQTSFDLAGDIPADILKVAESGIDSYNTLQKLENAGFNAFLIGESLMREQNIGSALQKISGRA